MKCNKSLYIALLVSATVSSLYLLILGYYALPVADDFGWARQVTELNPFGFVKKMYFGWQGRYSALFVDGLLCKYLGWNKHLLFFTIVELLLGYGAIYLILRDLSHIRNHGLLLILSVMITNLGVMSFPELGTFFWLCTTNYVHEIWVSLYLIWFVFCCHQKWFQWVGILLCSVYMGGCSENYPPVVIVLMGSYLMYKVIQNKDWRIWKSHKLCLLFVSTIVVACGFLVMYFAPGNSIRLSEELSAGELMNHFSMQVFAEKLMTATTVMLLRLLSRGWYFLCMFPLFILIGSLTELRLPYLSFKRFVISLCITLAVIVLSVAVMIYGLGWYATMRANCFMVYFVMAWVAYIGVLIGGEIPIKPLIRLGFLSSIAITITSVCFIVIEYPDVRKYNHEVNAIHDIMHQYVEEGRSETVYIQPVRIPYRQSSYGYLRNSIQVLFNKSKRYKEKYFPLEPFILEADSSNWRNQVYKYWLYADFDIVCIDEGLH